MIGRRPLLAAGATLLGPLAAPRLGAAQAPRVLKFVPQADLGIADPVFTAAYVTRNHALMVFDTLYGMDDQLRIQPQMAAGHTTSAEGLQWEIRLREGLRWHDGEQVLARDAVASIRRWARRDSIGGSLLAATEALDAPDDRTIRFRLKRRFDLLTYALGKAGSPVCAIMPERIAATDPFRQITEIIGSGPFRFVASEQVSGARVVYERNPAYVPRAEGTPSFTAGPKVVHFDRVEWQVIPDPSTAAAALRTGEVDWWEAPTFDLLPPLLRDRRIKVWTPDPLGYIAVMRFNQLVPPFDNAALRRALLPALNQADFMAAVVGDVADGWREGIGAFPPGTPLANDAGLAALTNPRDVAAARRAVQAAGYKGEKVVVLSPSDFPTLKALADVGADLLKQLGLNVDYQATDWATMRQRLGRREGPEQGGWNVFHTYWSGLDQLDPAVHQYLRGTGTAASNGWPTSPRLEALRDEWLAATTEGDRLRLAREIQAQLFVDIPYLPLGQIMARTAHKAELAGMLGGFSLFWNLRRG
ncbi:ABC transporter substrate-binding protein [Siccirubricoccus phaeus]|uniref:ABC transporter substrate-binding protein n=1 Tax=Siccirubricoccus phaeus TaxID=2595053 RepID=UPI0011F24A8F|nr:ABC transporter substrate-binding protein [Siccirubricoccus phaeus]